MEGSAPTTSSDQGLAREAIGLREVFFQSVTHMAPAAAVAAHSPWITASRLTEIAAIGPTPIWSIHTGITCAMRSPYCEG